MDGLLYAGNRPGKGLLESGNTDVVLQSDLDADIDDE